MSVCQHLPRQCVQVSYEGKFKCIKNFDHATTVSDIIYLFLEDLSNTEYLIVNDYCLCIEYQSNIFVLKSADLIYDIFYRYSSSKNLQFRLIFKNELPLLRFAQRKKLQQTKIDPFEQIKKQEILIQQQQEIINRLINFKEQSRVSTTNTRLSRQDNYQSTMNRHEPVEENTRSLSRVRFRLSTINLNYKMPSSTSPVSVTEVKSILKKSPTQRTSSVDRDIDQLISLKHDENGLYTLNDDYLSDLSTTDSCLGSLSSDESINQHHLETLV